MHLKHEIWVAEIIANAVLSRLHCHDVMSSRMGSYLWTAPDQVFHEE